MILVLKTVFYLKMTLNPYQKPYIPIDHPSTSCYANFTFLSLQNCLLRTDRARVSQGRFASSYTCLLYPHLLARDRCYDTFYKMEFFSQATAYTKSNARISSRLTIKDFPKKKLMSIEAIQASNL